MNPDHDFRGNHDLRKNHDFRENHDFRKITGKREEVEGQLRSMADRNCRRCYGQGHLGFNLTHSTFLTCKCVSRNYIRNRKVCAGELHGELPKEKRGAAMIVMYSLPNMLTLPYQIGGIRGRHTFTPGKNQVPDQIWAAIVSQNKARFDSYYSSVLREFKPAPEAIKPPDEGTAASGETLVDISKIEQIRQALDLIENTMELDELETYLRDEKQLKRPRRAVIKAITDRMAEINGFTARIREKKGTVEVT